MAKVVIAGCSDCLYYTKVELLGDSMVKRLPSFHVHKVVKTPGEWKAWLSEICKQHGWCHETSPLIYRELLDRGGKAVLIGGYSEFQEYVKGYYGHQISLTTQDMLNISQENFKTKQEIDQEEAYYRELSYPIYVCITAADSPVCYYLISSLMEGGVFPPGTKVVLRLLHLDPARASLVRALAMEAMDLCSPQLVGVEMVESRVEAFKNCSVVILLDEVVRKEEEEFQDWVYRSYLLFASYGHQISLRALKNVRVLVAGTKGLVNFSTMVVINTADNLSSHQVVGLSREIENRAKAVIARKVDVPTAQIADVVVWGNLNGQRFIDTTEAKVFEPRGAITGPPVYFETVKDRLFDTKWLTKEFLPLLESRRKEVEEAMGHAALSSTVMAITSTLSHWINGSPLGRVFSLAVSSRGWYGVPRGLVFSFPVAMCPKGQWEVVQDMQLTIKDSIQLIDIVKELIREAAVVYPIYHEFESILDKDKIKLIQAAEAERKLEDAEEELEGDPQKEKKPDEPEAGRRKSSDQLKTPGKN